MRFALILLTALLLPSPKPSPKPQPPVTAGDTHKPETDRKGTQGDGAGDHAKSYLSRLVAPENLPNMGLLIAGIFGICFAARTLKEVGRQADLMEAQTGILTESVAAAQKSADVAQGSMDAMISKERARITVKVDGLYARSYEMAKVAFFVHCHGLTEAFIDESRIMAEATESIDPPSTPCIFSVDIPDVLKESKTDCFVYVRNKREFSREDFALLDAGKLFVHFWGIVKYRDAFRNDRETAFCYVYRGTDLKNLADGSVFRAWSKNGPPEANRET
jgi:hypothetical protein